VAKPKTGEFYSFDEVLRQLNIDENRLKRLVSEGEIRAFREGDQMKFKRQEIDALAGRSGRGSQTSETSLTEISLEEESHPTVNVKKGAQPLSDELLEEPDIAKGGMRTAEISSQDTFIDQGDVGMSTEPIDFTEESGEEAEEIADMGVDKATKKTTTTTKRVVERRTVVVDEGRTHPGLIAALALSVIASICAGLVTMSIARGGSNEITSWFAQQFGPKENK
jgi:excisionase family DNA binding protein